MAHTDAHHAAPMPQSPVEADGVSYRGIVWFVAILTLTTVFCALVVLGMFKFEERYMVGHIGQSAPLTKPDQAAPPPNLLYMHTTPGVADFTMGESTNLANFRRHEEAELSTYGWVDRNAGTVRLPIEKAKELYLAQHGTTAGK